LREALDEPEQVIAAAIEKNLVVIFAPALAIMNTDNKRLISLSVRKTSAFIE
jgi:hypothetical protein